MVAGLSMQSLQTATHFAGTRLLQTPRTSHCLICLIALLELLLRPLPQIPHPQGLRLHFCRQNQQNPSDSEQLGVLHKTSLLRPLLTAPE